MNNYIALFDFSIEELNLLIHAVSRSNESVVRDRVLTKLIEERMRALVRTEPLGIYEKAQVYE